jgi:hypothetical protein
MLIVYPWRFRRADASVGSGLLSPFVMGAVTLSGDLPNLPGVGTPPAPDPCPDGRLFRTGLPWCDGDRKAQCARAYVQPDGGTFWVPAYGSHVLPRPRSRARRRRAGGCRQRQFAASTTPMAGGWSSLAAACRFCRMVCWWPHVALAVPPTSRTTSAGRRRRVAKGDRGATEHQHSAIPTR